MEVLKSSYGVSALETLAKAIRESRQENPLGTVTVVVPSMAVGLDALRSIVREGFVTQPAAFASRSRVSRRPASRGLYSRPSSGISSSGISSSGAVPPNGLFGVRPLTAFGLAEEIIRLASPDQLRPPLGELQIVSCMRLLDNKDYGVFASVRSHASTESVLVATLQKLFHLPDSSPASDMANLRNMANLRKDSRPQVQSLTRLHDAVLKQVKGNFLTSQQLTNMATDFLRDDDGTLRKRISRELGSFVVFLPQHLPAAETTFLRACQPNAIILGVTGDSEADKLPTTVTERISQIDPAVSPVAPNTASATSSSSTAISSRNHTSTQPLGLASVSPPPGFTSAPLSRSDRNSRLPPATQTTLVSAPTMEDEVRFVVRGIATALKQGTPPESMAVMFPSLGSSATASPGRYSRLITDQLRDNGIPFNFYSDFPLRERIVPRAVLAMIELLENDFQRDTLMNLLASAPVLRPAGEQKREIPTAAWDRVSRAARIRGGMEEWESRTERFIQKNKAEIKWRQEDKENPDRSIEALERNCQNAQSLLAFVQYLRRDIQEVEKAKSWAEKAEATENLIHKYMDINPLEQSPVGASPTVAVPAGATSHSVFGASPATVSASPPFSASADAVPASLPAWPAEEANAAEKLLKILNSLKKLGKLQPSPTPNEFLRTLQRELSASSGNIGKSGAGILVSSINRLHVGSVGYLWILGATEEYLPGKVRENPLLPDSLCEKLDGLQTSSATVSNTHRYFLSALQLPRQQLTISYSRLGKSTAQPSRWLLDLVSNFTGQQLFAEQLDGLLENNFTTTSQATSLTTSLNSISPSGVSHSGVSPNRAPASTTTQDPQLQGKFIPSFVAALQSSEFTFKEQEFNLRSLLNIAAQPKQFQTSKLAQRQSAFQAGIEMYVSRMSQDFTPYDGNLGDSFNSSSTTPRLSPSKLQDWVKCPFGYFMQNILNVNQVELLETIERLSPLVLGRIVHDSLEEFFAPHVNAPHVNTQKFNYLDPKKSWDADDKQRIREIASTHCQQAITDFEFGPEVYHSREIRKIQEDLCELLDWDSKYRQKENAYPVALEQEFGVGESIEYVLSDGTKIPIQGRIDRLDYSEEPDSLIVIDYKTGDHKSGNKAKQHYTKLSESNPDGEGRYLQLPIYTEAARQTRCGSGKDTASAEMVYWFVTKKSDYLQKRVKLTSKVSQRMDKVLTAIHTSMNKGLFPPGLHDTNYCSWCNPDGFSKSRFVDCIDRKLAAEDIQDWLELAYPAKLQESQATGGQVK